jgi:hypothetical protein
MRPSIDDPTAYPRVYRLRPWVAALWFFTGLLGIGLGGFCVAHFSQTPEITNEDLRPLFVAFAGYMVLFGIFAIASAFHYRVVLTYDKIQIRSFLRQKEMRRDNIAGLLRVPEEVGEQITLVSKDPRKKNLKFSDYMQPDEFFEQWLASIPDLGRNP